MELNQFLHGIKGLTKSVLGIDKTDQKEINRRLQICNNCQYLLKNTSMKCYLCKCPIGRKVKVNDEKCPIGRWENNNSLGTNLNKFRIKK